MKKNTGFAPIIIALVVAGILALGGIYYFNNKETKPEEKESSPIVTQEENEEKNNNDTTTPTPSKTVTKTDIKAEIPTDVLALLNKHNINLSKLIEIYRDDTTTNFIHDSKTTGYTFTLKSKETDELGITHVSFNIFYKSLPVFNDYLSLHFSKDKVTSLALNLKDIPDSQTPKISKAEALKIIESSQISLKGVNPALGYYEKKETIKDGTPEWGTNPTYIKKTTWFLAWKAEKGGAQVVLDASTGKALYSFSGIIID